MKLNEEKRDKIADAIIKEFSGFFKYQHNDSRINRLKETISPFCMEMTDEEIGVKSDDYEVGNSFTAEMARLGFRDGAKFIRDKQINP